LDFDCVVSPLSDRRLTFNEVALSYDAVRPTYPQALIEDVLAISSMPARGWILEVGCGSGQATLPFARRGYQMTCLDIGSDLLKLAAQKCQDFPSVNFFCTSFEEWQPGEERFDLLLSATAFHWIPPEIGYPKAVRVLKHTGSIALVWNYSPRPLTGFFLDVQALYRQFLPHWPDPHSVLSLDEDIQGTEKEIQKTGLFEPVMVKKYPWTKDYATDEYLTLLNTYSDHYTLEDEIKKP
jgi:SAM-dependent methyltransferase